ncbi:glycosyltransferase family 61 protein [Roseovarius sp. C7]|uniref:glycosyltransferase family 61 protein n=1 Tax=Roseovarius sp. C7 TaxID=3398643 RepID=UPI0039F688C4
MPATEMTPTALPTARIERIADARIVPMEGGRGMPHGVFRPDDSFCAASATLVSGGRLTVAPGLPDPDAVIHLKGRHLYAGIGRHHFGHFLVEGLGRLWAFERHADEIDGILIVPKHATDIEAVMHRRFLPFYSLLCDETPLWLVDRPARVDELLLPTPGFGHGAWTTATPEFRAFIRRRIAEKITPDGPERVYVSRTRFKTPAHRMDQEEALELAMIKAGYLSFHPEHYTLEEQCQVYMSAREIVGADGSAFHLAPFAMRPGTRVGLIQRRRRQPVFDALAAQIRAFVDVELHLFDPLIDRAETPPTEEVPDPIDLKTLLSDLKSRGFL